MASLGRTCLLPQRGGKNTSNAVPVFASDASLVPGRDTWYAEPAKVGRLRLDGRSERRGWQAYTRDADEALEFGDTAHVTSGVRTDRLDFMDRHCARARVQATT